MLTVKTKMQNNLPKNWLLGVLVTGVGIFTAGGFSSYILENSLLSNCGQGLDDLGCVVGANFIVTVLSLLIAFSTGVVLLKFLVLKKYSLSIFTVLYALMLFFVEFRLIPAFTGYVVHINALVIAAILFLLVINLLLHVNLFVHLNGKNKLVKWAINIALMVLYTALLTFPFPDKAEQKVIDSLRYNGPIDFVAYEPTSLLNGYREYGADNKYAEPRKQKDFQTSSPYYQIKYIYGDSAVGPHGLITFSEFNVPKTYQPPTDCGSTEPLYKGQSHYKAPCKLIGKTASGYLVYYGKEPHSEGIHNYFCNVDGTLIAISRTGSPSLSTEETLTMLNSLRVVSNL